MRRSITCILLILGLGAVARAADDFWQKKNYSEWSKAECNRLLDDSPWAQRKLIDYRNAVISQNIGAGEITYRVRLDSAEPIREAFIRRQQLEKNFEKMNSEQKKAFEVEQDQKMVQAPDSILVNVIYEGNSTHQKTSLAEYWERFPARAIPPGTFLTVDGSAQVHPISYTSKKAENEFELVFPKILNNQPLIHPGAKSMKLVFESPQIGDFNKKIVSFEFKLEKMMFANQLEY